MTQIKSRTVNKQSPEYQAALHEIAGEVAEELNELVDKMDAFLEMRITFEIDELKDDILQTKAVNDTLMEENMKFRAIIDAQLNEITALTIENMKLSMAGESKE